MAAGTAINVSLQARDWEFLMSISNSYADADAQDLLTSLRNAYAALSTKPQGSTAIQIATVERAITYLYQLFLTVPTQLTQGNNQQPYTRIRTAFLALNNAADNYILDNITLAETTANTSQGDVRKAGRRLIMMRSYDNL